MSNFFNVLEANSAPWEKKNGGSFTNTLEITEVLIGMNGLPGDSHTYTELKGNKALS